MEPDDFQAAPEGWEPGSGGLGGDQLPRVTSASASGSGSSKAQSCVEHGLFLEC